LMMWWLFCMLNMADSMTNQVFSVFGLVVVETRLVGEMREEAW